jgi:NitT/TauT family transport system substrate-binding protein
MMRPGRAFLIGFVLLLNGSILSAQHNKLVFTPHWLPQAQFAGFYVARDQGFYSDAGLDVEIIHPPVTDNALTFLTNGQADVISLFLVTGLKARSEGVDLVNIAQLSQHSAIMMVSMKESGIESLADFEGKRIGIWMSGFEEVPKALINEYGLAVEWVPILSSVNLFLAGGLDIMTVMYYNEYNTIYLSGIDHDELNTFFLSELGYDIPEDGLYTLKSTREQRPGDLKKFVEATMKGWAHAARNKEYAISLVIDQMQALHIPSNRAHQRWMLDKVLDLYAYEDKSVKQTQLSEEDFHKAVSLLKARHIISGGCRYEEFFRPVVHPMDP